AEAGNASRRYRIQLPVLASSFALSGDGARMAFLADDAAGGVYIANMDGSQAEKVFEGFGVYADWSPDGSALFAVSSDHFLYLADVRTLQSVRITSAWEFGAVWSPDGDQLAFVRNGDIFTVALNDFHERQLTYDGSSSNMWPCFLSARPAT